MTIRVLEIYKKKHKGAKKGKICMSSLFQSSASLLPAIGTIGYDLLKKKSDALTVRFRALLKDIYKVNYGSLFQPSGCLGTFALRSFSILRPVTSICLNLVKDLILSR